LNVIPTKSSIKRGTFLRTPCTQTKSLSCKTQTQTQIHPKLLSELFSYLFCVGLPMIGLNL